MTQHSAVKENDKLAQIALSLHEIGAIRFGSFRTDTGDLTPVDINLRVLISYPMVMRRVAEAYAMVLRRTEFDCLATFPYAGLPIGVAVSLYMNRPLVYPRKEINNKGIEGVFEVGQRAILIEDLITTGKSIIEVCAIIKSHGLSINQAVVLVDREVGGVEMLAKQGIRVYPIFPLTRLFAYLEANNRISSHKRAEIMNVLNVNVQKRKAN
ncbi:MAG: hypothetical protein AAF633_01425 [Chloroflexota bacterium]